MEQVLLTGEGIPGAVELFCRGVARRRADMALDDERVQVDHLDMVVQRLQHGVAGDARRQRRDGGEDGSLGHGAGGGRRSRGGQRR